MGESQPVVSAAAPPLLLPRSLVLAIEGLAQDNSSDTDPGSHTQPLPELRHYVLAARLLLPAAPSLNGEAKQLLPAIAGSYAVSNVLLPQSHTFSSHQERSFTADLSPIMYLLVVTCLLTEEKG